METAQEPEQAEAKPQPWDDTVEDELAEFYRRRRSQSEAIPLESKGRLVSAWTSFKRSWDATRRGAHESGDGEATSESNQADLEDLSATAGARDADVMLPEPALFPRLESHSSASVQTQPRKVVSLLLRRKSRGSSSAAHDEQPAEDETWGGSSTSRPSTGPSTAERTRFRRVRSLLNPPVANAAAYAAYAAELDDSSFERLRDFTRSVASARLREQRQSGGGSANGPDSSGDFSAVASYGVDDDAENAIIGEICLEDFADASSEDFDFLDDQSMDLASAEVGWRTGRRPSLKMDNQKLTWIGDESDFAAFFADFGLDDILQDASEASEHEQAADFNVSAGLLKEWQTAARNHNEACSAWTSSVSNVLDIRLYIRDYCRLRGVSYD